MLRILLLVICVYNLFLGGCSGTKSEPTAQSSTKTPGKAERVKITQFYASPPDPAPGTSTKLCYGVENATSVRLDPPVERMWPAMARCIEITPKTPATFTLTAERGEDRVTQTLTIRKGLPPVEIIEVRVDAMEVAPGTVMHVCYKARNAASVSVTPGEWFLQHTPDRGCVAYEQHKTTTYTVLAKDADGDVIDGEEVTVKVK